MVKNKKRGNSFTEFLIYDIVIMFISAFTGFGYFFSSILMGNKMLIALFLSLLISASVSSLLMILVLIVKDKQNE